MKKIILFSVIIVISEFCFSQDTIIKYNGDQVRAKVTEITATEIKYKKFDFQDGPTYLEKKSEVQMIKYSNGVRDYFEKSEEETQEASKKKNEEPIYVTNPKQNDQILIKGPFYKYHNSLIRENEVHEILLRTNDTKIIGVVEEAKRAKKIQHVGFIAFPLLAGGICCVVGGINDEIYTGENAAAFFEGAAVCGVLAITCPIVSGVFKHKRTMKTREAVILYNQKY